MSIPPTTTVKEMKIEVAPLETIDLARLTAREPNEAHRLLKAAQTSGFFYLDLRNDSDGNELLSKLTDVYSLSEKYFDQPHEVKMKDFRQGQHTSLDRGYKSSDCDETFEMAYEELVQGAVKLPDSLDQHQDLVKRFSLLSHSACHIMLVAASDALGLEDANRFEQHHRDTGRSESGLKLICEPSLSKLADVGDNLHTDSGTFTMVFCEKWGIQAELSGTNKWGFTAPMPGCALINVADSLQRLSGGKLHSPKHRVTQPADGFAKRYFVAYLLRPENALKEGWAKKV